MNDTSENGRPVAPEGFDGSKGTRDAQEVVEGPSSTQGGLVWILVGAACMLVGIDFACVLVAYGIGLSESNGKGARRTAFVVACLASILVCVLVDPKQIPYVLIGCLTAWVFSADGSDAEASAGWKCFAVAAIALAMAGTDAVFAHLNNTSLPAAMDGAIRTYAREAGQSASADMREQLTAVVTLAKTYWPMVFLSNAIVEALCSHIGGSLAARKRNARTERTFSLFDAPAWVAVLFIVGVAASLLSSQLPAWSSQVKMVGENVLTAARVALFLQGAAVATWYTKKAGFGPITQGLTLVAAFYLEVSFLLVSVVGLVDVAAANFRGLPRKRDNARPKDPKVSKESA